MKFALNIRSKKSTVLSPFKIKVSEISLQQLLQVIAELHVKVSVEECLRLARLRRDCVPLHVSEHADRRFPEDPAFGIVARNDTHAYAEVTIPMIQFKI